MLFSELYKFMVNKATFVGFRGTIDPIDPPWIRPWVRVRKRKIIEVEDLSPKLFIG